MHAARCRSVVEFESCGMRRWHIGHDLIPDTRKMASVCGINILDKMLSTAGYFSPFRSSRLEKKKDILVKIPQYILLGISENFMDKSIRKNEICVVGLPRCDFVFSSTRFSLPMVLIRARSWYSSDLLEGRGLIVEEAGGTLAPGQSAFCAKICSKIITSQFCIVLLKQQRPGR